MGGQGGGGGFSPGLVVGYGGKRGSYGGFPMVCLFGGGIGLFGWGGGGGGGGGGGVFPGLDVDV